MKARVDRATDRAAEGRPNSLERVVCAIAIAPPAVIYAAAALGDLERITPGACGGPSATTEAQAAAATEAAREWPSLAAWWTDLGRVRWPHEKPISHAAWRLVAVPEPSPAALAEAERVLANGARDIVVLRAHVATALDMAWPTLSGHPNVSEGLDALTTGTPWSTVAVHDLPPPPTTRWSTPLANPWPPSRRSTR